MRTLGLWGNFLSLLLAFMLWSCWFATSCAAQDTIEFMSGAKVEGQVTSIDRDAKLVNFTVMLGGQSFNRVYPYTSIHAVNYKGKRHVLNEKTDSPSKPPASTGKSSSLPPASSKDTSAASSSTGRGTATNAKAIIEQAGKTLPDWYEDTSLDYPKTLDLSWPQKPEGPWNNQKNVGQYLWDVINPNPGRWKSGVKLVHFLMTENKGNAEIRQRATRTLGGMYFNLFQDYARAAYWWQQGGVRTGDRDGVGLAECYWRLGDRKAAEVYLIDPENPRTGNNDMNAAMIKLWGDMGETTKATKLADWYVKSGGQPHMAYIFAGDACRYAGRYADALRYYQKVLDAPGSGKQGHIDQTKQRAQSSLSAIKLVELLNVAKTADGTYRASSRGYEDDVEVEVTVQSGRIESVKVSKHREKQFYSAITDVPNQILKKQGVKGVDATSRATITGEAIINATAKALAK